MKKSKIVMLLLAVIMAICVPLAACSKAEYSLDKDSASLTVGETVQLNVTSTKDDEFTVVWASDDESVATVSESGLVTAKAAGEANVTATVDGKELTCAVTVKEIEYSYSISKTSATLEEEETLQLSVTVKPAKTVTVAWSSSDDKVAKVSSSGLVTAVAEGKATIKAVVDGKELTCAVTVEKAPVLYTYVLNQDSARLEKGTTTTLTLTCDDREDEFTVDWASADEDIATVDEDGVVTAVSTGKVDITATVDGEEVAVCEVTVFEYVYTYEKNLSIDYGDTTATLTVSIDPVKPIDIKYEVEDEEVITISADGKITTVGVGETTVTVKDGEKVLGTCTVKVNYVLEFIESLQLHSGATHELEVICTPANPGLSVSYEVTEGDDVVSIDGTTLKADKDGVAVVTATIGETVLTCNVLVNDVNAVSSATKLILDRDNPYDISTGAEYWEQYISTGEINHKQYVSVEEDLIEREVSHTGKYLSDYKAFLTWAGGANSSTCDCGNCDKETNNGGDGGWTNDGTKAFCVDVKGAVITLTVKVYAGDSKISVYTGGYNLKETVTLKNGEAVIATEEIDNKGVHNANLVEFEINVTESTEVTIELLFVDDYGDTGHSVISLAAVSVSGSVYQLESASARIAPDGTAQINVTKDGAPATGVTYTVISGTEYASVDGNGLVTGITTGEAVVEVAVDGRVRYFTVNVGYKYTLNHENIQLHTGDTAQLTAVSDPVGGDAVAEYDVTEGDDVVSVAEDGTITALKDGTATVKVKVDGNELFCTVLVNGVNASVTMKDLTTSSVETLTGENVAYWEQYINNEVNYKAIGSDEEDVIEREFLVGNSGYFGDYAKLVWTDGDSRCVKPSKPDGFSEGALLKIREIGDDEVKAKLTVKVYAGQTTIKIYTGVFKGTNTVTLYNGETAIASYELRNDGDHIRNLITFEVDVTEATDLTIVLALTNTKADNSFLTLVAASVSGSTYQLDKYSARIMVDGTEQIVVKKDGDTFGGATYESLNTQVATVDANGLITAVQAGEATIKVTVDGRVRYFEAEVIDNYIYTLKETGATIKAGATYQIEVQSEPVSSDIEATYISNAEAIATVNSTTGLVTGVKAGKTTITVEVGETELTFEVTVTDIEVSVRNEDTAGTVIDLTSGDVIYWEHYLYDELNPKAIDEGERDLIDGSISGKSGDAGSTVKFYFEGSSGPKSDALNDGAFHKYSWSSSYQFNITVPAGSHEIRVYTGVWQTKNKTSLWDGENELLSYEFERTNDGINKLVAFAVTAEAEKVLTLKIEAVTGNNCRLSAIAIADLSITSSVTLTKTVNDAAGKTVDFTATDKNILDWATFGATGHEMEDGTLILTNTLAQGAGANSESDYKASFVIGEGETVSNFSFSDQYVSVDVNVTTEVKQIALYVTGWNADYYVSVSDANGKILDTEWVNMSSNNSVAKELIFDIDVTEATTLTLKTRKMSYSNCGIAAVALYGAQA